MRATLCNDLNLAFHALQFSEEHCKLQSPGQHLIADWMRPRGLNFGELADATGIPRSTLHMMDRPCRLSEVVDGCLHHGAPAPISKANAEALGRFFGNGAAYWNALQAAYSAKLKDRNFRFEGPAVTT